MIRSLHSILLIGSLSILLALSACGKEETSGGAGAEESNGPGLFSLLSPAETGLDFQNTLTEGLNTNILLYEYFYNGGGVAAGDLNGDGLIDLYFTSNMGDNKLYLNQGDMRFREVTAASGAGGHPGPWKTGVTMVDVNGDRRLDLYLCYSGAMPAPKRANQLFINEGNDRDGIPRFSEQAAAYGLDSPAFSNQGFFFDYDRDGDLDMVLLNHNPKNLPVLNEVRTRESMKRDDPLRGVRLFRQDEGRFVDVTQQAGVSGSELTYGLGLAIADVDEDGWPDFYLSNDYAVPDYLYINNHDGTFTDRLAECMGHNSHFSMGNDIADVNNDGRLDILTLDMLPEDNRRQKLLMAPDNYAKFDLNLRSGFHYQYMRNMLQLNNGNNTFSEIGQLAGISNTDWSWAALLADYDNDGWKDLYITNGYLRDYTNLDFIKYMDDFVKSKGRLVREDVLDIISNMPASDVVNYMFANRNGLHFSDATRAWGLHHRSNSNGAAYADLDNDGDLDLVVSNINQPAFLYRNEAQSRPDRHFLQVKLEGERGNTYGAGARVTLHAAGQIQTLYQAPWRGYLSTVSPVLHFGLGAVTIVDSLIINWPSGKQQLLTDVAADQVLTLSESEAKGRFKPSPPAKTLFEPVPSPVRYAHPKLRLNDFDRQSLLTAALSFSGPCMAKGDVNGDGREDLLIGGAAGQAAALYLQQPDGTFTPQAAPAFETDRDHEDADAALFDADGDGDLDLYLAGGGYHRFQPADPLLQDRLYYNDGAGNFSRAAAALPPLLSSAACVAVNDINGDGHPDLFVGGRVIPGRYPEAPTSYLLINDGQGRFQDRIEEIAPQLQRMGMFTDAVWTDLNGDATKELIVVGEWLPLSVFQLNGGKLIDKTKDWLKQPYRGWWNHIRTADFNGDGRPDLLAGNLGLNTQVQASEQEPAELYFQDFDRNGSVDPILCFYIQGKSHPYVTRDELLGQLAGFRSRYTSYDAYADVTINDLFDERTLATAGRLEAGHLETMLFLSNEAGTWDPAPLPVQAQYAPVNATAMLDYDNDGDSDLLLCGNNSHLKLRLGKMDANYGVLLRGDGRGGFEYVEQTRSGFDLRGDVRSLIQLGDTLLFGINQSPLISYRLNQSNRDELR